MDLVGGKGCQGCFPRLVISDDLHAIFSWFQIRLYLDLDANRELNRESPFYPLQVDDLLGTFRLLVDNLPPCASLVKVRPVFKRQQESFDRY